MTDTACRLSRQLDGEPVAGAVALARRLLASGLTK
jgi:hypothetical protein